MECLGIVAKCRDKAWGRISVSAVQESQQIRHHGHYAIRYFQFPGFVKQCMEFACLLRRTY